MVQDALYIHAGEQPAYIAHDCHPKVNLSKMDADPFSVPPTFRHQGQNDFSATLVETLGHLKHHSYVALGGQTWPGSYPFHTIDRSLCGIMLAIAQGFLLAMDLSLIFLCVEF